MIRPCDERNFETILAIINDAARAYQGHIPEDRYHEPYMSSNELKNEIEAGVCFWGYWDRAELVGVMGIQDVKNAALIRHAYVKTSHRKKGIGTKLLDFLMSQASKPMLVGTWKAATWAINFYKKKGFELTTEEEKVKLLKTYWTIPDRQIETSVVLTGAAWSSKQK